MSPSKSKGAKGSPRKGAAVQEAVRVRWERKNIGLFGAGLGAVVLGYVLLSQGSVTAAPVLLVAGYCVLIPLAFIL
ncbi:MAG TPA: hypothetical protein VKU85_20165 [bacterium]|nr:hypothetical protein [bacterium]